MIGHQVARAYRSDVQPGQLLAEIGIRPSEARADTSSSLFAITRH